jgi:hydroxypyruvate reductase/glycerate 2-kinase
MSAPSDGREHALLIWQAAVGAVLPAPLVGRALAAGDPAADAVRAAPRVLVVGAGKAGPGMAAGLEAAFADRLDRVEGLVNVPEGMTAPLRRVRLHPARPPGVNEPTAAGVAGADEMLRLLASAGPDDAAVCLLSGGGSALLPAPADGVSLADKLAVTKLLSRCGATITELNCVRKHLSRVKGGRLAEAFRGRVLLSLIISDVVGDPLDVIASGPTAADPSTFAEALAVFDRYGLRAKVPPAVVTHLERGAAGQLPETPKRVPGNVVNRIIGSNVVALAAAEQRAVELGYRVWNAGSDVEGETRDVAVQLCGLAARIRDRGDPVMLPACVLSGGETTVTLGDGHGRGGRNQEFALAALTYFGGDLSGITVLSGGTDGEDGPTDAAGAVTDTDIRDAARAKHLDPAEFLRRHDAYTFFDRAGGLLRTGLTGTNVMDVRVILVR